MNMIKLLFPLGAALLSAAAQAHVSLEQAKAVAGAGYKAVLRIGHGCEGTATHTVVVDVPAGFRGAKPMPKAGWKVTTVRTPLAQPFESHGRTVTDDVSRITWTASSAEHALPDAHFDEFVLRGQAPAAAGPAWFKVRQLCDKGEWNWSEVPAAGADGKFSTKGLKAPAVRLDVQPAEAVGHAH